MALDRNGKLDDSPRDKQQKVAIGLIRDRRRTLDFAGQISSRASKAFGPTRRYRVADILPHMKLALRASRPGLAVGVLRIVCDVPCTAQRFHIEGYELMCLVGCQNELTSLLTTTNALCCTVCFFRETIFSMT